MFWRIWIVRKAAMISCIGLLAHFAFTFQDYNIINNALLVNIQKQNLELKLYLESESSFFEYLSYATNLVLMQF